VWIRLSSLEGLESFRGAPTVGTTTVQGRPAIELKADGPSPTPTLLMHDDQWLLVIQEFQPTVALDVLQHVADGLDPLPFAATMPPPTVPSVFVGSVSELHGQTGPATVTGWLVIDSAGHGHLCDALAADGVTCSDPSLAVEWSTGRQTPPTDLVRHGTTQVSSQPISLSGRLKEGFLYVGI